ncbi:MAG: tape measure protein [Bacteroidales bacterium]|nr:tape measure protein [Bacteroidales bacterium]
MNIAQYIIDIAAQGDGQALSKIKSVQGGLDAADRSASRLSGRLTKSLGQAFRSIPGAEFIMNPVVALTAGIGVVSKLGMETEKTAVAFNVLVGNEDKAAKMLGEINKYADNTLWDRSTTQSAAQTMLGFGVSTETVVDDLKMLGDVAQGDKNRLQQLALVFGQISAAGKLQGQDLLQLINAGYNPLLDISAQTGKSVAQLKDDMSKGLVTFDMVRAAFQRATGEGGKFNNMTERIAQTSYGAFEQLKGKLISTLLELYNVIQPFIIPVLNALGKGLDYIASVADWASQHLNTLIPVFAGLAAGIAAYNLATNAAAIVTGIFSGAMKILNVVMSLNPVGLVVAGIAALTVAIVACWNKFAGFRAVIMTVWETVKGFGNIMKQYVIDRITGIITGIGYVGDAIGKLFKGDFSGAWESAKAGAAQISGVSAVASAAASARDLAAGVSGRFSSNLEAERQKQAAKNTISDPTAAAGAGAMAGMGAAVGSGAGASPSSTANSITTGGTRNTSIVLNIGKIFEDVNITNVEGRDFRELRDAVLESINRSLEIAVSAGR